MITQLLALVRSPQAAAGAQLLLEWVGSIGDKKQKMAASRAVAKTMKFQSDNVMALAASLEEAGIEAITPTQLLSLLSMTNSFAFELIDQTLDLE